MLVTEIFRYERIRKKRNKWLFLSEFFEKVFYALYKDKGAEMRLVELPVFLSLENPKTVPMLINPERIFFISTAEVPTSIVNKGGAPVSTAGTLISSGAGGGVMVNMLVEDVLELLFPLDKYDVEVEQDGNNKPTTKNKRGVCKSTGDVGGRPANN